MSNGCIVIIGAGISSLGAAYTFKKAGLKPILFEQQDRWGGLCGNFTIDGFRFDKFVHFSFTSSQDVRDIFDRTPYITHNPNPYNLYNRMWIKHPAQNNLFPLSDDEKSRIVADFERRPSDVDIEKIVNFEQWLRVQYGDYFAEHFPMIYTEKYWMTEAKNLGTKWVGSRLYQPTLDEVKLGCQTGDTPNTYYSQQMRYPTNGGYKSFLTSLAKGQDIRLNTKIVSIDCINKFIRTESGETIFYDHLISSAPLPELIKMLIDVPLDVLEACGKLVCTSGYMISVGLRTASIPPYLWWYIYDRDIIGSRVHSPSLKSQDNAPEGCSSIQMEVYCARNAYTQKELYDKTVGKLVEVGCIDKEDILFVDMRFENYANVVFDHNIYVNRQIVLDYLRSIGIVTIGRFGLWEYYWSDQSLVSGIDAALSLMK